jgi:hypothetical protein
MTSMLNKAIGVAAVALATTAAAQVTFYEGEGYRGRAFTADRQVGNMERAGFNDGLPPRSSNAVAGSLRKTRAEGAAVILRREIIRPRRASD